MRNIGKPTFIHVFPSSPAISGAKDVGVSEIGDCDEQKIGSQLFSRIDPGN
jgi:hypothetical protein